MAFVPAALDGDAVGAADFATGMAPGGGTYRRATLPGEADDAPDDEVPGHVTRPAGVAFPARP